MTSPHRSSPHARPRKPSAVYPLASTHGSRCACSWLLQVRVRVKVRVKVRVRVRVKVRVRARVS